MGPHCCVVVQCATVAGAAVTFAAWQTLPGGTMVRDYPGIGRITLRRTRMIGTRRSFVYTARLRPEGAHDEAWQDLTLDATALRYGGSAKRAADEWAAAQAMTGGNAPTR